MDAKTATAIAELLDREEIRSCLIRYSRGADRHDEELMRSAFHPDARVDIGTYVGSADGAIAWALHPDNFHHRLLSSHQHATLNTSIDLDGDTAHCESYLLFAARWKESGTALLFGGRYVDRLEKRDGRWAISVRVAFVEWSNDESSAKLPGLMAHLNVTQDRNDISYERPLTIRRDDMLIEEERAYIQQA